MNERNNIHSHPSRAMSQIPKVNASENKVTDSTHASNNYTNNALEKHSETFAHALKPHDLASHLGKEQAVPQFLWHRLKSCSACVFLNSDLGEER